MAIFCNSSWTFFCGVVGVFFYFVHVNKKFVTCLVFALMTVFVLWGSFSGKFVSNMDRGDGRMGVWEQSIRLANEHPWKGFGIGTYKDLFYGLSGLKCLKWVTAHNFIIQLCFEIGYPLTAFILLGLGFYAGLLYKNELWAELSGFMMIIMDAMVHTPDRFLNMVPLIVVFLAYTRYSLCRTRSLHS